MASYVELPHDDDIKGYISIPSCYVLLGHFCCDDVLATASITGCSYMTAP